MPLPEGLPDRHATRRPERRRAAAPRILSIAFAIASATVWTACPQRYLVGVKDDAGSGVGAGDGSVVAGDGSLNVGDAPGTTTADDLGPPAPPLPPLAAKVDILFVIDNSGSMGERQLKLTTDIAGLLGALRDAGGQPLDYRIAVASTDVGVGGVQVDPSQFHLCNNPDKPDPVHQDKGVLQTTIHSGMIDWDRSNVGIFACGDPTQGIPIGNQTLCAQLVTNRQWLEQNCTGKALTADRPYIENNPTLDTSDADVGTQFRCIASLGVNGCFIEQPLEAARAALAANRQTFLRPDALLAVVFLTDETDCSLANPSLVDPNATGFNADSDVGFRCYLDAQTCTGVQLISGTGSGGEHVTYHTYSSCTDNPRWLIPVDDYASFLGNQIKGQDGAERVALAALSGNPDYTKAPAPPDGPGPLPASVAFVWESHDAGMAGLIEYQSASCIDSNQMTTRTAAPNPRLDRLLRALPDPVTGQPLWGSVCDGDYTASLAAIGRAIRARLPR
jgi:hypothetical protein